MLLGENLDSAKKAVDEQQSLIVKGNYNVDVSKVLPNVRELLNTIGGLLEQTGSEQLQRQLLSRPGIEASAGMSFQDALTSDLSRRLERGGMSAGEAEALASLVVGGDFGAMQSLPKMYVDIVSGFLNNLSLVVSDAVFQYCDTVSAEMEELSGVDISSNPGFKVLMGLRPFLPGVKHEEISLEEEEAITAMLKLMGEAIDEMIELTEQEYRERKELERELRRHNLI